MSTTTQRLKGAALILVALNLRITIAAISPLLAMIERQTGISSALAGVLTTVPVVCFGAFALLAPRLIARLGMARLLGVTMLAVALGAALRLIPDLEALFVGTAVIGAGIAVGNVLLPGLIKRDFHTRAGLMTGLYSVSLFVGAALSSGLTVPLQRATGLAWRPTLALWGLAALAAFLCWVPFARSERTRQTGGRLTLWRDRVAWLVSGFMGLQSLGYYATLSWLPTLLKDHQMASAQAGWMLSFSAFPGMAAALATPLLAKRVPERLLVGGVVGFCGAAYLGLVLAPVSLAYLWMVLLGVGQGLGINLALGFIIARAPDSGLAAQLSTMAQAVGYLLAAAGPFLLGALHQLSGEWTLPLIALGVVLVPLGICGLGASRERFVAEDRADSARC